MTKISCVYKITNLINNKIYIGSTYSFKKRKNSHINLLNLDKHGNRHLQNAWNKYGEESFKFEILEKCEVCSLIEREQYYINNLKPDYNILKIANSLKGYTHSEKTKKVISEKMKQRIFTEKHKENIRKSYLGKKGKDHPAFGKKRNQEQISKMKKVLYKKVHQYDLNLNFIQTFSSVLEASDFTKISASSIASVARRKSKNPKKYIWRYEKIMLTN
jgi:group I intron endonuclease